MADKKGYIYIKVSNDEYELPVAVADTAAALSLMLGLNPKSVTKHMTRCRKSGLWCCYRKVYIGDSKYDQE